MAVKIRRHGVAKKASKFVRAASPGSGLALPAAPKEAVLDFFEYITLIYGVAGIGKTTLVTSFPDTLMLSCERVSKGIPCYDFNSDDGGVHNWDIFRGAVKLLQKERKRFRTVGIDTIDAAYRHCLQWVCRKEGIDDPGDAGYGKGWAAVRNEFTSQMLAILETGRGIVFTSHAKEVEVTSHSGDTYTVIKPSMSGQALGFVEEHTDNVFYAEYMRGSSGSKMRVLVTEGDELIMAKHASSPMPKYIAVPHKGGAKILAEAFSDGKHGIDPSELRIGVATSEAAAAALRKERLGEAKKKLKRKAN